jgi:hypothetical protein
MSEKFELDLENLKIEQLSFVYKDIKKHAKIMEDTYGIKFAVMENIAHNDAKLRGKDVSITLNYGFSRLFGVQIELQQPSESCGDCIFKEFLDQGKEGLHAVGMYVQDLQATIEELKKMGIEVLQEGKIGKNWFAYFDTENSFGALLEFQEVMKRRRKK